MLPSKNSDDEAVENDSPTEHTIMGKNKAKPYYTILNQIA